MTFADFSEHSRNEWNPVRYGAGMKTKSHGTLPLERKIYSLIDAAKLADCTPIVILQHAAANDIFLCVEVPHDVAILSIDGRLLDLENTPKYSFQAKLLRDHLEYNKPAWNYEVSLLFLTPADCTKIAQRGSFKQDIFSRAGRFDERGDVVSIPPNQHRGGGLFDPPFGPMPGQRLFSAAAKNEVQNSICTVYRPAPRPIELRIDNLQITSMQFTIFQRLNYQTLTYKIQSSPEADIVQPWFVRPGTPLPNYFSRRMLRLYRTTSKILCKEYATDEKYPGNTEIEKELREANDGIFSKTLAGHAATIIRPDYANGTHNKVLRNVAWKFSQKFLALKQVAYEFYANPASAAEEKKRPSHSTLTAHFRMEPHNFPPYLAEAAASIIRYTPDDVGR